LKKFLSISGGNLLRQLLTFLGQLYVVKETNLHSFGEITIAFSVYLILAGLSDFGSRLYCWKTVLSVEKEDRHFMAVKMLIARTMLSFIFLIPIAMGILLLSHGRLEKLLLLYSFGVVANQAGFDWFFLSLNRVTSLFLFNVSSGILYLLFLGMLVSSEATLYWVPVSFSISYFLPAILLLWRDVKSYRFSAFFSRTLDIPVFAFSILKKSHYFFYYDFLQRVYTIAIFLVAWSFYPKSVIGGFRVAHLVFIFVSSLSIYLGISFFNDIHEESVNGSSEKKMAHGIAAILLVILPISMASYEGVAPAVQFFMGVQYDVQPLEILLAGLILPALANFMRETAVAAGHSRISTISYGSSILLTSLLIFLYHPSSPAFLAVSLLLGELIGVLVLFSFLPLFLFSKIRGQVYLVAGFSGTVIYGIEKVFSTVFMDGVLDGYWKPLESGLLFTVLFTHYLLAVKKRGIDTWVK
jgi:O-antigen/teichoic acid export membrane protein